MTRLVDLPVSSRLNATPLLQRDGTNDYFYGIWGEIVFEDNTNDRTHIVTQRDLINWPLLAHEFYGDFKKMWIIWAANGIVDPFAVTAGTRLRIPDREAVDTVLSNITKDAE
jgi:hypothetical protein